MMRKWLLGFVCFLFSTYPTIADDWLKALVLFDQGHYQESVALLTPLAEDGNLEAQEILYAVYTYGYGVPVDHDVAFEWLQRSAEQGAASAQDALGRHYLEGRGTSVDQQQGIQWLRLAARQGYAPSIYSLGVLTLEGVGVAPDPEEGWRLIQWAADLSNPDALFLMGINALEDVGSTAQFQQGLDYLTRSARLGARNANAVLGILMEELTEDPDHRVKSAFYYQMAVAAGCLDLTEAAAQSVERLSPAELEQLDYNLAKWTPVSDPRDPRPAPARCMPG